MNKCQVEESQHSRFPTCATSVSAQRQGLHWDHSFSDAPTYGHYSPIFSWTPSNGPPNLGMYNVWQTEIQHSYLLYDYGAWTNNMRTHHTVSWLGLVLIRQTWMWMAYSADLPLMCLWNIHPNHTLWYTLSLLKQMYRLVKDMNPETWRLIELTVWL